MPFAQVSRGRPISFAKRTVSPSGAGSIRAEEMPATGIFRLPSISYPTTETRPSLH